MFTIVNLKAAWGRNPRERVSGTVIPACGGGPPDIAIVVLMRFTYALSFKSPKKNLLACHVVPRTT
jgi:hypothetical protein